MLGLQTWKVTGRGLSLSTHLDAGVSGRGPCRVGVKLGFWAFSSLSSAAFLWSPPHADAEKSFTPNEPRVDVGIASPPCWLEARKGARGRCGGRDGLDSCGHLGSREGRVQGQPRGLVQDPHIHQISPSSVNLLNPNEVIAMRENQIKREGEEEDEDDGEKTQTERGHQTRSPLLATQQPRGGAWC